MLDIKASGYFKDPDTYDSSISSPVEDKTSEIFSEVQDLKYKPRNAPVIYAQETIRVSAVNVGSLGPGTSYIRQVIEIWPNTKNYVVGMGTTSDVNLLLNPNSARLSLVRDIILNVDISYIFTTYASPPTVSSDYSVDFYLTILLASDSSIQSSLVDRTLFCRPYKFTWSVNKNDWVIEKPQETFYLNNFIEERNIINVYNDFSNDKDNNPNDKISRRDFEQLASSTNRVITTLALSADSYAGLTASEQTHFDFWFNTDPTGSVVLYPTAHLSFVYLGIAANYKTKT